MRHLSQRIKWVFERKREGRERNSALLYDSLTCALVNGMVWPTRSVLLFYTEQKRCLH